MKLSNLSRKLLDVTSNLSLVTKGLLLVLMPLGAQVLFILVLWHYQSVVQGHVRWSNHSKEVLQAYAEPRAKYVSGLNRSILSLILDDSAMRAEGRAFLADALAGLEQLEMVVHDNPTQVERVRRIRRDAEELRDDFLAMFELSDKLAPSPSEEHERQVQTVHRTLRKISDKSRVTRELFDEFSNEELQLDRLRSDAFEAASTRLLRALGLSTVGMVVIGLVILALFSETFWSRVQTILSNVETIPRGTLSTPTLRGSDELARIDRAIHTLAQAVADKDFETELFIYSISHDLRSPLVNLHGFSEEIRFSVEKLSKILASGAEPSPLSAPLLEVLDEEIYPALRFIESSKQRMSTIVDALLRLSRAGRGDHELTPIPLSPLIERMIKSLHLLIEERDVTFTVGALPTVYASLSSVEQIFQNLITNALKYLRPGVAGTIEIGTIAANSPHMTTIFVRDNGLGISAAAQEKLFLAFQRFHPDAAPGDGVGLALVKRLVSRSGGAVWCESTEGQGTCFYVSLPIPEAGVGEGNLANHKPAA